MLIENVTSLKTNLACSFGGYQSSLVYHHRPSRLAVYPHSTRRDPVDMASKHWCKLCTVLIQLWMNSATILFNLASMLNQQKWMLRRAKRLNTLPAGWSKLSYKFQANLKQIDALKRILFTHKHIDDVHATFATMSGWTRELLHTAFISVCTCSRTIIKFWI